MFDFRANVVMPVGASQQMYSGLTHRSTLIKVMLTTAALLLGSSHGFAQSAPSDTTVSAAPPASPPITPSDWGFRFTPYGWLTWMSGSQTVKGRTVDIDTNVFQLLDKSQSLIPFMGYFEARYQDRLSLFVDVMYANISTGTQATKNFRVDPFVAGGVTASVSMDYDQFIMEFGGTYQVAKVGPDRSTEGAGLAGVGQTAFDILWGGRYWYQKVDMTLNVAGTIGLNIGDLELSRDGSRAYARSGSVSWVDPFVGFRVRHRVAAGHDLTLEADLGGFGLGSRITAQAMGIYAFDFGKTGNLDWAGVIGYRALYVDYSRGSGNTFFQTNLLQHGPVFGISARF